MWVKLSPMIRGLLEGRKTQTHWCPSIHMPRWASRLTLEITDVRVQRLHEIDEGDAIAEGMEPFGIGWRAGEGQSSALHAHQAHQHFWEALHGIESCRANPWVWALTFRVHQQNIDSFHWPEREAV